MLISVDFDNTIAIYDGAFRKAAFDRGIVTADFAGDRVALREAVRNSAGGETAWMTMQGYVYGSGIGGATLSPGFGDFARRMAVRGHRLAVVSHKTRYGHFDTSRTDLRQAALGWMKAQGLLDGEGAVLLRDSVYFESTRLEKVQRIASLSPAVHVDDLIEVFADADYPKPVCGVLIGETTEALPSHVTACRSWREIETEIDGVAAA